MLPDGFSLYTLPGGPGLAAIGSEETVKDTLEKIKAAADKGFLQTEMIVKTLQEAGLNTALLVFDGTGAYANGYTGVLAAGKYQYASL